MKTVAIVCPTVGTDVHVCFALSLTRLAVSFPHGTRLVLLNPRSSIIANNRNEGVSLALKGPVDYVLFIDTDMSFPPETAARYLEADKDIIGANYIMRNAPHKSLVVPLDPDENGAQPITEDIMEVKRLPTGLMMIKASVFDKISKPWFKYGYVNEELCGEDYMFCDEARNAGFKLYCDTWVSERVIHWGGIGYQWTNGSDYKTLEG